MALLALTVAAQVGVPRNLVGAGVGLGQGTVEAARAVAALTVSPA